jgi:protein-disulfide isomerase
MRRLRAILLSALLLGGLLLPRLAAAQGGFTPAQRQEIVQILRDALRTDPTILRDAVTAMQADDAKRQQEATSAALASYRQVLTANPGDPVAGNPTGDVTIVEFYDTRCPYCRAMLPAMAELLHADPGVRLVFKDMPILGPASQLEARALLAAQRQGGYARMQDVVMHETAQPTEESLRAEAERLGMDGARFARDMDDPTIGDRLQGNIQLAQALDIQGTPALIIGGKIISGAVDEATLQQAVNSARNG